MHILAANYNNIDIMLPPALGGLRFRVPPVPGRHAPGSMEKITPGIAAVLPPLNRTCEL